MHSVAWGMGFYDMSHRFGIPTAVRDVPDKVDADGRCMDKLSKHTQKKDRRVVSSGA